MSTPEDRERLRRLPNCTPVSKVVIPSLLDELEAAELRTEELEVGITGFIIEMDKAMGQPASFAKGQQIARLVCNLENSLGLTPPGEEYQCQCCSEFADGDSTHDHSICEHPCCPDNDAEAKS